MNYIFVELTAVLVIAGVLSYLLHFFKQPSIVAYIITGLLIGPLSFYHLQHVEILHGLADIGITLLLFTVGLDLDVSQLKRIGKASSLAALIQLCVSALLGFGLAKWLGFSDYASIYMAIALTFSSTIIVVKLLTEKKDLTSLYGKLALGILLMQDVAAIFILIFLSGVNGINSTLFGDYGLGGNLIITLAKAFMIGIVVITLSRTVFPKLIHSLMKSDELLLIFGLAWSLGLAAFFTSPLVGFNAAIGGFVAGLALANTGAHYQISGRIKSLRDFFLIIFFIVLGSQLVIGDFKAAIVPALILSAFVLIIKPLVVTVALNMLGYKPRTAFFSGLTLGQVSEFSLILIAIGLSAGHFDNSVATIITLVAIITIAVSSYQILYAHVIYRPLQSIIQFFAFRRNYQERDLGEKVFKHHIIIVGANRLGSHIIEAMQKQNQEFVIVDFDPDVIERYTEQGLSAICGDIADQYIQDIIGLTRAKMIVSTVPDLHDTLSIIESLRLHHKRIKIIASAQDEVEASTLYDLGVDYVLLPHYIGGLHLADIVGTNTDTKKFKHMRDRHLKTIQGLLQTK